MNKYENLSKEQLLELVEKQEKELKSKKYGLVWDAEREPEQVVLDCENNLPVLKRVKGKEIKTNNEEDNILIEGDNYHALTVLNYTHKEKIDVIYIDPPYNTGAKDWKYNNSFVGEDDGYRHSKWLNMMEKRLNLSRDLLRNDGIICVTVDDYELPNLWLLLNKIFGTENRLGTVTVRNNPPGRALSKYFATSHEYYLFYAKNLNSNVKIYNLTQDKVSNNDFPYTDSISQYTRKSLSMRGHGSKSTRPKCYYPLFVNKTSLRVSLEDGENMIPIFPPIGTNGKERVWDVSCNTCLELILNENLEAIKENERIKIYKKVRPNKGIRPKTVWFDAKYDSSAYGAGLLKTIFSEAGIFDYPKSIYAVKDAIKVMSLNKDAIILDFFAGSGTTGHSVLELNKEDGGNRKFILCTNNENNICEKVTYPRIKKVINGYKYKGKDKNLIFEKKITWTDFKNKAESINDEINKLIEDMESKFDKIEKTIENGILKVVGIKNIDGGKKGLGGNLQYFKTSFVKKTKNRDQVKINLTRKCTEMLCVKENIFNEIVKEEDYKIFASNKKDKFLCVYYNFLEESFGNFLEELKKLDGKKIIYMFSLENKADKSLFKKINNFTIEPIPQKILDVYRQLVKMNIPEKKEIIFIELNKANNKIFTENEKDEGARILRIVLEKTIQKIAQGNGINILNEKGKEEKISKLNDLLKNKNLFTKLEWEENKTYLTIGNHAAHGEYDEYELKHVKQYFKHVQSLLNNYNI